MLSPPQLAIAASDAAMAMVSASISIILYRLSSRLGAEAPAWAGAGFAFLALSGLLGAAMGLSRDPRLAATLYTGSTAAAAVALALLAAAPRASPGGWAASLAPLAMIPSALDALAAAAGAAASARSRGPARLGLVILAGAHAARFLSLLLAPRLGYLVIPLSMAEIARATAVAVMLGYYASRG